MNQIDYQLDITSNKTKINIINYPRPTFVEYSFKGLSLPLTLYIEYLSKREIDIDIYYSFVAKFPN